jgi:hypothetical protein
MCKHIIAMDGLAEHTSGDVVAREGRCWRRRGLRYSAETFDVFILRTPHRGFMNTRTLIDKEEARQRRNRMLDVDAGVLQALEHGQTDPTLETLNRIGKFFGLQVGFVRIERSAEPGTNEALANIASPHDEMMRSLANLNMLMQEQLELTRQHQALVDNLLNKP